MLTVEGSHDSTHFSAFVSYNSYQVLITPSFSNGFRMMFCKNTFFFKCGDERILFWDKFNKNPIICWFFPACDQRFHFVFIFFPSDYERNVTQSWSFQSGISKQYSQLLPRVKNFPTELKQQYNSSILFLYPHLCDFILRKWKRQTIRK